MLAKKLSLEIFSDGSSAFVMSINYNKMKCLKINEKDFKNFKKIRIVSVTSKIVERDVKTYRERFFNF